MRTDNPRARMSMRRTAGETFGLLLILGFGLALGGLATESWPTRSVALGIATALIAVSVIGEGGQERRVKAGQLGDAAGRPRVFTLTIGAETVTLDPGKPWIKVDSFKWVTRGLIEAPQSFHILPNGTVDINGEKIPLDDADGIAKLEHEINKRHTVVMVHKAPVPAAASLTAAPVAPSPGLGKAQFKVRLDHLGHLMVECIRGPDRVETGLRGLPTFVLNGFMLKPQSFHVDPLQRAVEIDGVRFECTEDGARQLQEALNARYAPPLKAEGETLIHIKDNPASPTGFDIDFVSVHAGLRLEVKGHLSQEKLDLLQDPTKCDLLQLGIVLRLTPPNLLIRRRRPDGGEERVDELPDIQYRRATALQVQQVFNHPLIRRTAGEGGLPAAPVSHEPAAEIVELRVLKNPQTRPFLWLACVTTKGGKPEGKAFTHHNMADLQHRGIFLPHLDVTLSLDNRTLSILNQQTRQEETITVDSQSSDADLGNVSRMLTAALKPSTAPPANPQAQTNVASTAAQPSPHLEQQ